MKHKDLFSSLQFFKKIREDLMKSFSSKENFENQQTEVLGFMFEYEKNEQIMELIIERFAYNFANQHLHIFEQDFSSDFIEKILLPKIQVFFQKEENSQTKSKYLTEMTISFLKEISYSRREAMNKFIEFKEEHHQNREKINSFRKKENVLFLREIEKYAKKENI